MLLIRLGRALGYETLVFTTEVDAARRQVSSTLVDLRSPFATELFNQRVDLLERGLLSSPSLVVPHGAQLLDEAHARVWVDHVAAAQVLCLTDPTTAWRSRGGEGHVVTANSCARPCNFTQERTLRLACPGHVSWELRNEPHPGCYKY